MASISEVYSSSVSSISSSMIHLTDRQKNILQDLKAYIKFSVCMMFVHLSISACILSNAILILSIVPIIIYYVFLLFNLFIYYQKLPYKLSFFYLIVEYICILISISTILYIYVMKRCRFIYSIFPFIIYICIKLFRTSIDQYRRSNMLRLTAGILNVIRILIAINLSLKMDGIINWDWVSVLWPVWMSLGIMGIVGLGTALVIVKGNIRSIHNENSNRDVISLFWIAYTFLLGCASIGMFMYYVVMCLENHKNMNKLAIGSIFPTLYFAFFCIYTQIYLPQITLWCDNYLPSNLSLPISVHPISPNTSSHSMLTIKSNQTLKRVSSTFYKQVKVETPIHNSKLNKSYTEAVIEPSLITGHRRSSSFSVPKTEFNIESNMLGTIRGRFCGICCENECDAVMMSCGHGGVCHKCALKILKTKGKCHLCRKDISKVLKIKIEGSKYIKVISTTERTLQISGTD